MLLAGGLSVVASTAHAYTINTTEVGKRIRWSVETVRLRVDPEFATFLSRGQAHSALEMGFEAWRGLSRVPDLVIEEGQPENVGHHDGHPSNGVYLLRDWPYEPSKLAVTVVTYEMDTGRLLDADIVVNGAANFALLDEPVTPGRASYDLAGVLTHEAGHVLGLGESASGVEATMWPYAKPDDTEKRTLAEDDEDGVIESYLGAPPSAASGCGFSTVSGRRSSRGGMALCLGMLGVIAVLRFGRRRPSLRPLATVGLALLCAGLVGFDLPQTPSADTTAQLDVLERLVQRGTREDLQALSALETHADSEIARRAHHAAELLRARPATPRVAASTLQAQQRLAYLRGTSQRLHVGRAQRLKTVEQGGLFFTEYQVRSATGHVSALRIPGGARDGLEQRVMDSEPPPADAQEVVVAEQGDGSQRWAYHQAGVLFGGDLGDGVAIEGAL
jgi:hypothetical protein